MWEDWVNTYIQNGKIIYFNLQKLLWPLQYFLYTFNFLAQRHQVWQNNNNKHFSTFFFFSSLYFYEVCLILVRKKSISYWYSIPLATDQFHNLVINFKLSCGLKPSVNLYQGSIIQSLIDSINSYNIIKSLLHRIKSDQNTKHNLDFINVFQRN